MPVHTYSGGYVEKLLYDIEDVEDRTSLGRSTIYALMASGRLESVKVGARRLVPADSLEDFVRALREEGADSWA